MRILLEKLRYKKSDNCHLEFERENGKVRKRKRRREEEQCDFIKLKL